MTREKTSSRRRGFLALTTILAATAAVVLVMPAFALDTSVFELDGNAVTDHGGAGIPDDWDRVCHQVAPSACPTASNTAAAVSVEWLAQGASTGTTFTGGGSKDPLAIEGWAWNQASGGLPGKDVLLNGFAARYTTAANNTICPGSVAAGRCSQIFFGMDRFDNSGDAQNGFWFFQNAISTTGGVPSGGGTTFTCTVPGDGTASPCHKLGDILVVSDFSIGGTISTITVYEWDPACTKAGVVVSEGTCADSNLAQISPTVTTAKCTPTAPGVPFCGIVNPVDGTTSPWPFADKKGSVNTFAQGEFYEGGIDLSNFPGLANECFASTLAESRASTSTSAVLKSFLLGNFGGCTTTVTTQSTPATSESIGGGSASTSDIASVTVTGAAAWTGTLQFYLCGPSASSCSSATGLAIGSGITVNQNTAQPISSAGATVTSVGSYCWAARFTSSTSGVPNGNDNGAHECFTVIPVTPTLRTAAGPGPVLLGNPVTDTATLAGTANQPGSPVINGPVGAAAGGSITFTLFGPTSCSTLATGTGINPQTVSVSGDNTYGPVSFTPNQVGTYHWVASYSGNSPNTLSTSHNTACNDTGEDVTVTQIGTTTVTTPVGPSGTPPTTTFGSSVSDNVTVSAASNGGPNVTGTVAFFICDPTQLDTSGLCSTGGASVPASALTPQATTPPSSTATSGSVTVNKIGTWCFRATYTPDTSAYTGSSDFSIGECFTVKDTTTPSSIQTWVPNDSASVSSNHGAPLPGGSTLTIQLYDGSTTCAVGGTAVGPAYTATATGSSSTLSVSSNNSTPIGVNDSISWGVNFVSSDSNVASSFHCESSTLTVSN